MTQKPRNGNGAGGCGPGEDLRAPENETERAAIRQQLERMLAHPLFRNSKRCHSLLRYVVECTLAGEPAELKERTLGVEVFGREASYDTNADPIVRATAGDLRKRLAQYYVEQEGGGEIRIDLRPGSYLPRYRFAEPGAAGADARAPAQAARRGWIRVAAGLAAAGMLGAAAMWIGLRGSPATALDRFWQPVLESPRPVQLCIGQRLFVASRQESVTQPNPGLDWFDPSPVGDTPVPMFKLYYLGSQNVSYIDAVTMARLGGYLESRHKPVTYRRESTTSFSEMRDGPTVLIGAFNNEWTLRLTAAGRFCFHQDWRYFWIEDRWQPGRRTRLVDYQLPYLSLTEDYALISRVRDPNTEQVVVVVAGLTGFGTHAAGEFLSNPAYMAAVAAAAPRGWAERNMQVVVKTTVIRGNSGPPVVVDRHFW
jgi:hypothetical protein